MRQILAVLLCIVLILPGCAPAAPVSAETLTVVASFYPLYIAAMNIVGDTPGVTLSLLAPPDTGCLHDYQLRPDDMRMLEGADVFLTNGGGLESFLDKAPVKASVVTATQGIELLTDDGAEEPNPHAWVSVTLFCRYVENIRDGLCAHAPSHRDAFEQNAAAYLATLETLAADMHAALDGLKNRDIVCFHEAFPYFAREFDLHVAAVIQREPGVEPTPVELAETIDLVSALGIKALFAEPQYAATAADAIARETGATVYTLDPAATGALTKDAYETAMRANLETLVEALG